jgi:hypothetical protein
MPAQKEIHKRYALMNSLGLLEESLIGRSLPLRKLWATRQIPRSRCWGTQKGRTAMNNATLLVIDETPSGERESKNR